MGKEWDLPLVEVVMIKFSKDQLMDTSEMLTPNVIKLRILFVLILSFRRRRPEQSEQAKQITSGGKSTRFLGWN